METKIGGGGEAHHFYGMASADMRLMGKRRTLEWDLNDWKWDGDLFIANPMNSNSNSNSMAMAAAAPNYIENRQFFPLESGIPENGVFSNSSSSCSDEVNLGGGGGGVNKGKRELEKRRRVIVIEDENLNDERGTGTLALKLGGHDVAERELGNWEGTSGKKTKFGGGSANRAVCQVENCGTDLSNAKDYHRRHKVCDTHSKANKALVGSVMQRFCQQCSRFHVLQEFDEGKRSCRRRLAGHNKRRRKTQPDTPANGNSLNDDQASGYLLISLLRILSNIHSNKSDQTKDQDLLSHLLSSLASNAGAHGGRNISGLLKESQDLLKDRTSNGNSEVASALLSNGPHASGKHHLTGPSSEMLQKGGHDDATPQPSILFPIKDSLPAYSDARDSTAGRMKLNNIDLNDVYIDSDDGMEDLERSPVPTNQGTSSFELPLWLQQDSHQSSPPQTSGNSDSASAPSPSSSSGKDKSRTDRIVFKLFGKEPNDFPIVLRAQILDWLSHSPTDIESYIRPGCVVLTIYLRLAESEWEELCGDLSSSLSRLLDVSDDTFWRAGWVYIRVQDQIAFIYNGQVVLDAALPLRSYNYSKILSVTPIAISVSEKAQFSIKGLNLPLPSTRLLCALEGKYLIQEDTHDMEGSDSFKEHDELQRIDFSCSIPPVTGRGFFEVEDHGLSSSFFPFIVAENDDICTEIRMLENAIESETDEDVLEMGKLEARTQAMDFVQEMGWLLHRSQLKLRLDHLDPNTDLFPLKRFKWLMEFSMDHDWCAVVKKLLDILLNGTVSSGEHPSLNLALSEMGLLHKAVRRNSRPLVQLLLKYAPEQASEEQEPESKSLEDRGHTRFLFTPAAIGPAALTPLHIAAGRDGSENVLDALTDDPGVVGIEAWKNARDSTGYTPEDYARLRGHYSYIHLVQKKINRRTVSGQVVLDIPGVISDNNTNQKQSNELNSSFEIARPELRSTQWHCKLCDQRLVYGKASRSLVYRPAMLSMVAIAAVCVCVALLFKSSPEVLFVFRPFSWELLDYGSS